MLGILCKRVVVAIVRSISLLATSLLLVVTSIPTYLIRSLPLFDIRSGLVREVLLCIEMSCRSRRSRGQSQKGMHIWCEIDHRSWWGFKADHLVST